jgi:hypothetical protein
MNMLAWLSHAGPSLFFRHTSSMHSRNWPSHLALLCIAQQRQAQWLLSSQNGTVTTLNHYLLFTVATPLSCHIALCRRIAFDPSYISACVVADIVCVTTWRERHISGDPHQRRAATIGCWHMRRVIDTVLVCCTRILAQVRLAMRLCDSNHQHHTNNQAECGVHGCWYPNHKQERNKRKVSSSRQKRPPNPQLPREVTYQDGTPPRRNSSRGANI